MRNNQKAFTLIELLVIMLIIGILAAVAIPMYENALAKTRAVQLVTAVKNIAISENRYFLESNAFTTDPTLLDIAYPLNNDSTAFEFHFGSCDFTYIDNPIPQTSCQLSKPHITLLQHIRDNRFDCLSHSDDNYKGDFVCQELTGEEEPYKTEGGEHYFSTGVTAE